jgi:hypothetical protein
MSRRCFQCSKYCRTEDYVCAGCHKVWYCSRACSTDVKAHEHRGKCGRNEEFQHPYRFDLRFKVGDRVLCLVDGLWQEAVVVILWDYEEMGYFTYKCRVVETGFYCCSYYDDDYSVRKYEEPGLPRLLQSVRCGDGSIDCGRVMLQYGLDLALVGTSPRARAKDQANRHGRHTREVSAG